VTKACPNDAREPASTVCRSAAGVCDTPDFCDGGVACPADLKEPSTVQCRASQGICDVPDFCDGVNDDCTADAKEPNTFTCREAAGICDKPDLCDGVHDSCTADVKVPAGTTCRASDPNNKCDPAEACDGTHDTCPADVTTKSAYLIKCAQDFFYCGPGSVTTAEGRADAGIVVTDNGSYRWGTCSASLSLTVDQAHWYNLANCNADTDCIPTKCPASPTDNKVHDLSHSMEGLCSNNAWALELKTEYGSDHSETCSGSNSNELPVYCPA
jgi:hypothetical protein